jgi:NAD(P)-dependent dehydrogenase (short-subunit alcohol dehydrogenase family)
MPKTVLISGANRGIGLAFAKNYVAKGYNVIATSRSQSEALNGLKVTQMKLDISSDASIAEFKAKLADIKIDLLINNAGILYRDILKDISREAILEQFNVNAVSPILLTKQLLENLNKDCKVVFISSSMGSIAENGSRGFYGYRASKTGLNMLVKSLSNDLKDKGIACLALHPGYIKTDMTNGNGDMEPDEAVEKMSKVIDQFNMEWTGQFRHRDGREIPF